MRSGVQDQPGQDGETPYLLKIKKLARHGGKACNPSYLRGWGKSCLNPGGRGCSELRLHHCTPAWATERNSVSKNKIKQKKLINQLLKIVQT